MTKEEALIKIQELNEFIKNLSVKTDEEDLEEKIQSIISSKSYFYIIHIKKGLKIDEKIIYFELPAANTDWFFEVMRIAEEVCKIKDFNIYPSGNIENLTLKLHWSKK